VGREDDLTICYTKERKMIEFSFVEIALFCWAVIATGYALRYKQEARASDLFVRVMLERKDVRDKLVAEFEEFKQNAG
jgi:hypothetical protein